MLQESLPGSVWAVTKEKPRRGAGYLRARFGGVPDECREQRERASEVGWNGWVVMGGAVK